MAGIGTTIRDLRDDIDAWCAACTWWIRLPVLGLILHQSFRQIKNEYGDVLFSALDFGIHELGHVLFMPLGEFMSVLGGSFWQLAAPVISAPWRVANWKSGLQFHLSLPAASVLLFECLDVTVSRRFS